MEGRYMFDHELILRPSSGGQKPTRQFVVRTMTCLPKVRIWFPDGRRK